MIDEQEFGQYRLVEVISGGPEESLLSVVNNSQELLFAKRVSKLFREDKDRIRMLILEYETLSRLNYCGIPQPVELVENGIEVILVFESDKTISLEGFLEIDSAGNEIITDQARLSLIKQILNRTTDISNLIVSENVPEIRFSADYRPTSILLTDQGVCKMGLLSVSRPCYLSNSISQTPYRDFVCYAAPEQVIPGKTPDFRSSYYGLGVLVYLLATGKHLFHNSQRQFEGHMKRRKAQNLYPLVSDVNPSFIWMDEAVSGLLDSDPNRRVSAFGQIKHLFDTQNISTELDEVRGRLARRIEQGQKYGAQKTKIQNPPLKPDLITNIAD